MSDGLTAAAMTSTAITYTEMGTTYAYVIASETRPYIKADETLPASPNEDLVVALTEYEAGHAWTRFRTAFDPVGYGELNANECHLAGLHDGTGVFVQVNIADHMMKENTKDRYLR